MQALRVIAAARPPFALLLLLALAGCEATTNVAASADQDDECQVGNVAITDSSDALTFARVERDGAPAVLAVTRYQDGEVEAIDLGRVYARTVADPINLVRTEGYDGVREKIVRAGEAARIVVPAGDLLVPVDLGYHHVAAGTNFPEHAGEAQVEDGPFLFAKLVEPTGALSEVSAGDALLDYEVELAWVAIDTITEGAEPAVMGLLLCNDFTDRAALLRHIDVWEVASGRGFTTGKSFPGYLPVGNLFVVPRDHRSFGDSVELSLYVNGQLRQRARVSEKIWDIDQLLVETFARRRIEWDHRGERVSLLDGGTSIPARTLILSGTPSGTVFQGIGMRERLSGAGAWLAGGWGTPLSAHVVEAYIARAQADHRYLQPGDRVSIHADHLGVLDNRIVP